eukprot:gnl/TRDRNA2_/TRDRNA2_181214_c0_seq1.p1 gnl/TRDRNA2_/TRDRNA2_181214_c0~~gnl/TRDRNA2_/TRDRNA2_181214_c0_seq1.p1  ORF type:complete len:754 (+),score=111.52 gnl/TRDRNA2_/TRDRNA2_181214_c0_seq1:41-2302(+)
MQALLELKSLQNKSSKRLKTVADALLSGALGQDAARRYRPASSATMNSLRGDDSDCLQPDDPMQLEVAITPGQDTAVGGETKVLVTVQTPKGQKLQPVDICCVLDISGSMGTEANIQGSSGRRETHGLSLLDVAKHGVKTVGHTLGKEDRLSVVLFNQAATCLLPLTAMDKEGQAKLDDKLDQVTSCGGTMIWSGIQLGLESLRGSKAEGRFGHLMVLTDGQTSDAGQVIPNLKADIAKHEELPGTISTFGFGYSINSPLLCDIATEGNGMYSFIPDAGFIGTVFVNTISQLLVTMATNVYLDLAPENGATIKEIHGVYPRSEHGDEFERVHLGTLQYGQSKDIVVTMSIPCSGSDLSKDTYLAVSGAYKLGCTMPKMYEQMSMAEALRNTPFHPNNALQVEAEWCRCKFATGVERVLQMGRENSNAAQMKKHWQDVIADVHKSHAGQTAKIQALLDDMKGQVLEAVSDQAAYNRWGKHYLPSIMFAHNLQFCNNFKDPGVQHYGGVLFKSCQDAADTTFDSLPPPRPSVATTTRSANWTLPWSGASGSAAVPAAVSMASYNDRYAGCIDGSSLAERADGSSCRVCDIRKGDWVKAADGVVAEVLCVVRTWCPDARTMLVEIPGGARLTPYHPVLVGGKWQFPLDLAPMSARACDQVLSFVLRGAPALVVDGVPCITLAHGIEGGAATHPYFGSHQVLDDLAKFEGFEEGLVELPIGSAVRDPVSGMVCGLRVPKEVVIEEQSNLAQFELCGA